MSKQINISAGLDLHKVFIEAAILTPDNNYLHQRFNRNKEEIMHLRDWLCEHEVEVVACESTSDYWLPVYTIINPYIPVIVGNAYDMKVCLHKKTDELDAEHIAQLARAGMVSPSRIFLDEAREFRSMTRLRHKLVQYRTSIKNQVHHILESLELRLSRVLSDIFGKTGTIILEGIINGMSVDKIFAKLTPKMASKLATFKEALMENISPEAIARLASCLKILKNMNEHIKELTIAARNAGKELHNRDLEIAMSMPGIGEVSALTLISEIGNPGDFSSGEKIVSWFGLAPRVYQSAGKLYVGSITKRGTTTGRWALNQIAHAAIRAKDNAFRRFYESKAPVIGKKKAIMAVARKILVVLWHLLTHDEFYSDETYKSVKQPKNIYIKVPNRELTLKEVFSIFTEAHIALKEADSGGS